jgi:hypothetical protein
MSIDADALLNPHIYMKQKIVLKKCSFTLKFQIEHGGTLIIITEI